MTAVFHTSNDSLKKGLINVAISIIYALFGFQIKHLEPETERAAAPEQVTLYGVGNRRTAPTMPEAAQPV